MSSPWVWIGVEQNDLAKYCTGASDDFFDASDDAERQRVDGDGPRVA